jgi:hypothetical protein
MDRILKSFLSKKLNQMKNANLYGLDKKSFETGYANGFVNGFNAILKVSLVLLFITCGLLLILIIK